MKQCCAAWRGDECCGCSGPRDDRVSEAARARVPSLRLRSANPGGGEALLGSDLSEFTPIWARDTRRRLFVNLEQLKLSVMFSVTAPGADLYPFDSRLCSHSPSQRCSGRLGCGVNSDAARAFNQHAGKWWSQLHRAAKLRADRATGFKARWLRVYGKSRNEGSRISMA